ncbi:MAG: prepilin peptidase, partial [Candidatus Saganbacteria bacterium]|nr:prepilin peptidase [Candidatus Saganbacteria bacterium]
MIAGSFLNVLIYRLPLGRSIVSPGSRCPSCGAKLRPIDLLPLLSFMIQRGRCRYCRANISLRYPAVELLTALLFSALYLKFSLPLDL